MLVVPVGLFGAAMKTSFVRAVIAASIGVEVESLVPERNAHRDASDLQRVEHVARKRGPTRDRLVAGIERCQET